MNTKPHSIKKSLGFTLIEVMVALSIFAVCASILVQQSGRSARQSAYLETRTLATWLAQNRLSELRSEKELPKNGKKTSTEKLAGREWLIETITTGTDNKYLRKVEVFISDSAQGDDAQKFSLIGYLGQH
jgi:general secretion pathway protein I